MADFDPSRYIEGIAGMDDRKIDLAAAAIALAAFDHHGMSVERYFSHMQKICRDVSDRYSILIAQGADDDVGVRLAALKYVLCEQQNYHLGQGEYTENADLIRVIERREGLPVALSIIYISVARSLGWEIEGLVLPEYFLCRIEKDGVRMIFDPAQQCKLMAAQDLRALVKNALGKDAELSASYLLPQSPRQILVNLQNYIKRRYIEMGEYGTALRVVQRMRRIDPQEYRLLLDEGVLLARTGQRDLAIVSLEAYIAKTPDKSDRYDAQMLLYELRGTV